MALTDVKRIHMAFMAIMQREREKRNTRNVLDPRPCSSDTVNTCRVQITQHGPQSTKQLEFQVMSTNPATQLKRFGM